jgi:hypothetical protein
MISTLLGLTDKPIFEILYRSAYRAMFHLEPDITLRPFATQVVRQAKAEKLKIETIDTSENLYLVENLAWLIIIPAEQDLHAVRKEFLSRLLYVNDVKGAFILACKTPPIWGWAQVSEGARMRAQRLQEEV